MSEDADAGVPSGTTHADDVELANQGQAAEDDVFVEGEATRMAALRVWASHNKHLCAMLLLAFMVSLTVFAMGIYCHSNLKSIDVFTGLNAVPWLGGLLTALTILFFLPVHMQSSHAGSSTTRSENIWLLCVGLSLIIDLLTMCFAAANATETFLDSETKGFATALAVLYAILIVLVLLSSLAYLGCLVVCLEQQQNRKEMRRRASEQPMVADGAAKSTSSKPKPPTNLDFDKVKVDDFANAAPATGGSAGGPIMTHGRPSSQVFDTGSPMSVNATV